MRVFLTILLSCDIVRSIVISEKEDLDSLATVLDIALSILGIIFVWRI